MEHDSRAGHFREPRWADFVRNLGSEEDRREMQAHLDVCEPCRVVAERLRAVAAMAVNERMLVIPQEFVDRAKEIAEAGPSASGWIENLTAVVGRLIESIPLDWQPSGVRSLGETPEPAGDRMLFRAADYAVYLEVEPLLGGEVAEIIGDIVNEREHEESMEGIPVQMIARGQTLSETSTNRFGEFLIQYPIRKHPTLRFALKRRGQRIDLPLGPGLEEDTFGDRK